MTVLINLLGQPSSGKTSLAAKLFSYFKDKQINVEFSPEYVKSWAWENRRISPYDQYYIFGKEAHHQSMLFNKVDFIISDSPVMLTAFYHMYYNNKNSLKYACRDFYKVAEERDKVKIMTYFLPRKKEYVQEGRFQTQEEADYLSYMLKNWLDSEKIPYKELICEDENRLNYILEDLLKNGYLK